MQARFPTSLTFLSAAFFLVLPPLAGQGRARKANKEDLFVQWARERAPRYLAPLPPLGGRVGKDRLTKEILPLLKKLALGKNKALAGEALLTYAAAAPMESLPRVMEAMTQARDPWTRRAGILAAGLGGEPGAAGPLGTLISPLHKDGPEKNLAALSLGLLRGGQGKTLLLQTLQRMLSRSQQAHAQSLLGFMAALTFCGTPGDANPLIVNLEQDKFAERLLRGAAAWLAARLDFPSASKILFRLLRRKRDGARPFYLAALAYAPPKEKKGWQELYAAASRHFGKEAPAALEALEALASRGGKEGARYLARLARRAKGPWAHLVTVARGRAKVKAPDFVAALRKDLLKAKDPERRAACALALGFQALPGTGPALHQALMKETDPFVQGALALGLGLCKANAADVDLAALFFRSRDPFPVEASALALAALGARKDPPASFWREGEKGGGQLWAWKLQWLGWFGGEGTLSGLEKILSKAPLDPQAVTGALRALRVAAAARKEAPAARIYIFPTFPVKVDALDEARAMLWGRGPGPK